MLAILIMMDAQVQCTSRVKHAKQTVDVEEAVEQLTKLL